MNYRIHFQCMIDPSLMPKKSLLRLFAKTALSQKNENAEVTIRIVDAKEMSALNKTYRQKEGVTNILSFPFTLPAHLPSDLNLPMLGDIVICAEVVNREAIEQDKTQEAHWAHMIIHGIFHLLGYNHEEEEETKVMETLEIGIMKKLGYPNPYNNEHLM